MHICWLFKPSSMKFKHRCSQAVFLCAILSKPFLLLYFSNEIKKYYEIQQIYFLPSASHFSPKRNLRAREIFADEKTNNLRNNLEHRKRRKKERELSYPLMKPQLFRSKTILNIFYLLRELL